MKVPELVLDIISRFKTQQLEIVKGYKFNQYLNVIRINLYLNQRFLENSNQRAIFWDLSTPRIIHTAKNIDIDTKDLMPYAIGTTNMFQVWITRVKLRKWLRENHLPILLDDLTDGVSAFGSCVWKICKDKNETEIEEVDLRNLYFDQTTEWIKNTNVVELHYLSPLELKHKTAWDNIDKVLNDKPTGQSNLYEVWEFWGEVDDNGIVYKHEIGYGYGDKAVTLYEEETTEDKFPYRDFHIGKYRGRWQRIGIVERLYKLQEQANTLVNQNAQATEIASLLLLRSTDTETGANVLEQARNGQIINSLDLQQIGIDNRAFSVILNQLKTIEDQADKLCLTPDVVIGETMPSGTPFRSVAAMTNAARSAFKSVRDRLATGIEEILREDILPGLVKGWQKSELANIAENADDIKFYEDSLVSQRKLEALARANRSGKILTPDDIKNAETGALDEIKNEGRVVEIPKNYFNFDFGLRFMISAEAFDKQQQNDAMSNALQMVQQNPAITSFPLFKQYCENNGIEWWRLTPEQVEQMADVAQKMGVQASQPKMGGVPQDKLSSMINQ